MTVTPAIRAEAEALFAAFRATGALPVEADILQPAGTLLDLYGEDIRARAYITQDPLRGEMVLRPDFTVPVVQAHMAHGADPARYTYMGEVFRKQDHIGPRASEYLQVGFEMFDRDAPEADAEVFALFSRLLAPLGLRAATGDIGILLAAIEGLSTTERRKAALRRHVWRPRRFRALLDRFSGRAPMAEARSRLLAHLGSRPAAALMEAAGPRIGLRSADEIAARAEALLADSTTAPIAAPEAALLYDLLGLSAPAEAALMHLRGIESLMPAISPAVDRFASRLSALRSRGIDTGNLPFEASLGRTTLEYYDGFVFSFHAGDQGAEAMPPVASGGRYDALTAILGQGRSIPAVGGIVRPALVAQLKGQDA
ncbi:ATP phosphoribosyltransferase regulatory subunit [Gemmobacter fulvus]|uniref:ATP phosphoribosyltransferase regulatory subunit n=1 Tax=Gemmobacter fulvus TaxID=2840474 RepID=A0A975PAE3_9RHOB|nr:ATP phosphoribosyltransferase regulatory subunit [Gemmobacter fulvus]MBT9247308.1 ATP phosphoribosyltransferase regulatory subunit [Gemmobacter fulvus]QWK91771.1 ATP phosphoribosyltransferase regulatory subunit [Gemmobacter fulvus]